MRIEPLQSGTDFFVGGAADVAPLAETVIEVSTFVGDSDWKTQDNQLSGEALERFLDISDAFDLEGLHCRPGTIMQPSSTLPMLT